MIAKLSVYLDNPDIPMNLYSDSELGGWDFLGGKYVPRPDTGYNWRRTASRKLDRDCVISILIGSSQLG